MSQRKRPSSPAALPALYETVLVPTTPYVREGLLVKRTQLHKGKARLPFHGLFAAVDLPKYAFLGYYTGHFYDERWSDDEEEGKANREESNFAPPSHYAVNGSYYTVVPPGEYSEGGVNARRHPLAMMNEPPAGHRANATVVEWATASHAVPGVRPAQRVGVLAVHACEAIRAGEEIYFYYGDSYDRRHYGRKPHNVGRGCAALRRESVPAHERPRRAMLERGVVTVPEGHVYIVM